MLTLCGNGAATSETPFVVVLECWREDARRLVWQTSLVCHRVWFPGHGSGTTHLVQT